MDEDPVACHKHSRGWENSCQLCKPGQIQTSNFTCAEPNTYLGRPKLLSWTVDSNGRSLHVPNLIRGEKKFILLLKIGKYTEKSNDSPSLEILVLIVV